MLFDILTMRDEFLLHTAELLVRFFHEYCHVVKLVLSPLTHGLLDPELLVAAQYLGRSRLFPSLQVLVSLELIDHCERALEGRFAERVGKDLTTALPLLCVILPAHEQSTQPRTEMVVLILVSHCDNQIFVHSPLFLNFIVDHFHFAGASIRISSVFVEGLLHLRRLDAQVSVLISHLLHHHVETG